VGSSIGMRFAVDCVISSSAEKSGKLDVLDFSLENVMRPSDV
jgi:hypothetical protein